MLNNLVLNDGITTEDMYHTALLDRIERGVHRGTHILHVPVTMT
jgi:hypothetical protein